MRVDKSFLMALSIVLLLGTIPVFNYEIATGMSVLTFFVVMIIFFTYILHKDNGGRKITEILKGE